MTLGRAMPKSRRKALAPLESARASDALASVARPVLDEVAAFCDAFLPSSERDDFELATALYVETHPAMRERLHDVLAHTVGESGPLSIGDTSPGRRNGG